MRTEIITKKSALTVWLAVALFLIGAPSLWAQCDGTIYFKAPASWTNVYVHFAASGNFNYQGVATLNASTGYYEVAVTGSYSGYIFMNEDKTYNSVTVVNASGYNHVVNAQANTANLTCPTGGGTWYVMEDPLNPGKTYQNANPPSAKYFYIMLPEEIAWMSSVPMISTDGGITGTPLKADPDRCGWYYTVYDSLQVPGSVVIYRDDDTNREDVIGLDGLWGDGTINPIPLDVYFDVYQTSHLYFIPDDGAWPASADPNTKGWFTTDPGVEGTCTYELAAVIYDTDASLHPSFSCYVEGGEGCQTGAQGVTNAVTYVQNCDMVRTGIVQDLLGNDKKPQLNMAGAGGQCFPNETIFNQLFNATAGVNEVSCFDLPFSRSSDGKWEFDSDYYLSPGTNYPGGFYPVENTTNADVVIGSPTPAARQKRFAEGPVPYPMEWYAIDPIEGAPKIDLYCNTAGWLGGVSCDGSKLQGAGTPEPNWGVNCNNAACPDGWVAKTATGDRWNSTRNQHFCFESHANFVHKPGLNFTFRGDDDIWVFIAGKLAVDNGGTHLAAPGYVKLDQITDKNGRPLVVGETYDIDIFFCDRRTTQSNVRIKTNMYIKQSSGLDYQADPANPGGYELCYETSGSGTCADVALGGSGSGSGSSRVCGEAIGKPVHYHIVKRNGEPVVDSTAMRDAKVYFGGIDLTNRYNPKVDQSKIGGLPPGTYRLIVTVEGKTTSISFRIAGNLDVMTRNAKSSTTSKTWTFRANAMAGIRIPVYISAFVDNGAPELEVDEETAEGQAYSLTLSQGLLMYADSTSSNYLNPTDTRLIGSSGVDTVWVTASIADMTKAEADYTVQVVGRPAVANLTFRLPAIAFVDSTYTTVLHPSGTLTEDPEDSWMNSAQMFYLAAYDPTKATFAVCEECNFTLGVKDPSIGLDFQTTDFVNGKAELILISRKGYEDPNFAEFTAVGSGNEFISVTWDSLQFFEPPFPVPVTVELYDTKGPAEDLSVAIDPAFLSGEGRYLDGIADSLVIKYSRLFHKDSLPDSIFVFWDYTGSVPDTFYLSRADIELSAKAKGNGWDSVLVFKGKEFSKEVRTAGLKPQLESWATYEKNKKKTVGSSIGFITEKIAPLIVKTRISATSVKGRDQVRLMFSEPLAQLSADSLDQYGRELFSYYLRSADVATSGQRYSAVPAVARGGVTWNSTRDTVTLIYDNAVASVPSPRAGDFVRIRAGFLKDTLGNAPTEYNAMIASPWIQLEGDAKSEVWSIGMTTVDPKSPEIQERIEKGDVESYHHIGLYDTRDSIINRYPGTLGYIVRTDMSNILSSDTALQKLNPEDIWLVTETFYFTNLGSFVAEGGTKKIACNDPLFNGNDQDNTTKGDCRVHPGYVYVAWNLLAHNKRLVGTGAYIAKLSTYVQIKGKGKRAKHDLTELWGVRRQTSK